MDERFFVEMVDEYFAGLLKESQARRSQNFDSTAAKGRQSLLDQSTEIKLKSPLKELNDILVVDDDPMNLFVMKELVK